VVLGHEAQAYYKAKMYDQAVATYQRLLTINPNDASAHNGLGAVYADTNKLPEAQAEFQKSAQLDPGGAAKAYYNEGAILSNAGKMDEAAAAFKQATTADPKFADAYFLEAQALMGKATVGSDGKVVPAPGTVEALQTYLQLDPKGKYADSAQAMLQSVTGTVQTDIKSRKKKGT
jgi:tetratricopeptide (TPR) repeat protein